MSEFFILIVAAVRRVGAAVFWAVVFTMAFCALALGMAQMLQWVTP